MGRKKKIIRPVMGMDMDSSPRLRDGQTVYEVKNLRFNSKEGTTFGEYTNFKGAETKIDIFNTCYVHKIHSLLDHMFVFATYNNDDYVLLIKSSDLSGDGIVYLSTATNITTWYFEENGYKLFSGDLNFQEGVEIDVKSYYEDGKFKVYWSTEGAPLRALKVDENVVNYGAGDLEILPSVDLTTITDMEIIQGNLSTGKICYCYKLLSDQGISSSLSSLSRMIFLNESREDVVYNKDYQGSYDDTNSKKGVKIRITNIPSTYSTVQIFSVHYTSEFAVPKIKLIYDSQVEGSLSYSDTGSSILSYSPEEFFTENNILINSGNFEIKNNQLFIANYEEDFFDVDDYNGEYWDARAYRFDDGVDEGNLTSIIYDYKSGESTRYITDMPEAAVVPQDHDCVNLYNKEGSQSDKDYKYKYDPDWAAPGDPLELGATGVNVEITQNNVSDNDSVIVIDRKESFDTSDLVEKTKDSYTKKEIYTDKKTFIPEEVYRLGVQFKNSKGQLSYVKWICDYKYSYDEASDLFTTEESITTTGGSLIQKAKILSLSIDVSNIPNDKFTGAPLKWRVMYVPIEDSDVGVTWGGWGPLRASSIDPNGVLRISQFGIYSERQHLRSGYTTYAIMDDFFFPGSTAVPIYNADKRYEAIPKYKQFLSPEYLYGNKLDYSKIRIAHSRDTDPLYPTRNKETTRYFYEGSIITSFDETVKFRRISETILPGDASDKDNIIYNVDNQYNLRYSESNDVEHKHKLLDSDYLTNYAPCVNMTKFDTGAYSYVHSFGGSRVGSCQVLHTGDDITASGTSSERAGIAIAYVDNFELKYGGYSNLSRKSNEYIALSDWDDLTIYGDSYIAPFHHLRLIAGVENPGTKWNGGTEIITIPVYTRHNLNFSRKEIMNQIGDLEDAAFVREEKGVHELDNSFSNPENLTFQQNEDFYTYNKTYSRNQKLNTYTEKPLITSFVDRFESRILASNIKRLGESADSFLKMSNDFIDVDGQYGPILKMLDFNDKFFFFQERAFGLVSINERAVANASNGTDIILGQTGVLSRYDYLSTEIGISDSNHVCKTKESLYIINSKAKELIQISGTSIKKFSIEKKIDSLVKKYDWSNARIIYDKAYNEVLFIGIPDGETKFHAIVFNEQIQAFTAIYRLGSTILNSTNVEIDNSDRILINDSNDLLELNKGDYNTYDGSPTSMESEVTFIVSTDSENIGLFTLLEFIAKEVGAGSNKILSTIRIYNDDHDTGELDFYTSVVNSFGKFRTNKLRNYIGNKERIIGDHIFVTIKTDNNYSSGLDTHFNTRVYLRDLIASFTEYNYYG